MTKNDKKVLAAYVSELASLMGLQDWLFEILDELPKAVVGTNDTAFGTCEPIYGRRFAKIAICEDFRELPAEQQRWIVTHELLHCHFAHVQEVYEHPSVQKPLGTVGAELFDASMILALEYGVDAIARAWNVSLPKPVWP